MGIRSRRCGAAHPPWYSNLDNYLLFIIDLRPRKGVPHTSFQIPGVDSSNVPRETIEIRAVAYFEDDVQLF